MKQKHIVKGTCTPKQIITTAHFVLIGHEECGVTALKVVVQVHQKGESRVSVPEDVVHRVSLRVEPRPGPGSVNMHAISGT